MKTKLIVLLSILGFFLSPFGLRADPTDIALESMQTTLTNIVANSTNSTISTVAYGLPQNGTASNLRLTVKAISTANSSSNLVVKFSLSVDGTNYTAGATSNIKVTVPLASSLGTTNVASDWFYLPGVEAIKASVIENPGNGNVSNIVVNPSFFY